jgi:hypothetical protein
MHTFAQPARVVTAKRHHLQMAPHRLNPFWLQQMADVESANHFPSIHFCDKPQQIRPPAEFWILHYAPLPPPNTSSALAARLLTGCMAQMVQQFFKV